MNEELQASNSFVNLYLDLAASNEYQYFLNKSTPDEKNLGQEFFLLIGY